MEEISKLEKEYKELVTCPECKVICEFDYEGLLECPKCNKNHGSHYDLGAYEIILEIKKILLKQEVKQ